MSVKKISSLAASTIKIFIIISLLGSNIKAEENYIKYESYGEINLTEKGLKRAKNVKKKYVVIKKFLDEVLKFDTSKSHIEACNLEHAFSDESITKLNTLLKFLEKNK